MNCTCGHPYAAHTHWRHGTDCGNCDCPSWHPNRWWRRWLGR